MRGDPLCSHAGSARDPVSSNNASVTFSVHDGRKLLWKVVALRDDILRGLRDGEFYVVYQPQFAADGSRMCSVEALVHSRHPRLGLVGPADFIPLAEQEGVIHELGAFVLARQCGMPGLARDRPGGGISSRQLGEAEFADWVIAEAGEAQFPLKRLELEIVESAVIDNFAQAHRSCHDCAV